MPHSTRLDKVLSVFRRNAAGKTPNTQADGGSSKAHLQDGTPTRSLFVTPKRRGPPRSARKNVHSSDIDESQLIPAACRSRVGIGASPLRKPLGLSQEESTVQVVVRVRPRNKREANLGGGTCVEIRDVNSVVMVPPAEPHSFAFDDVAGEGLTQEAFYNLAGRPIVENALRGYNGCLLAYGQTGSGKTYTMMGEDRNAEQRGIIPRIFEDLFAIVGSEPDVQTKIVCSFLEIYNETITDLLVEDNKGYSLALREDTQYGVFVEGLTTRNIASIEEVYEILNVGIANRRVGETQMNERSSRSHSVFSAMIERKTSGRAGVLRSRLHLVDLAGSERQKSSGAVGERLKEASAINKSLSALGLVIAALVDQQQGKARHIPYRDSKLTFLLQDSLGGNAKTILVAAISPSSINASETLSTLRFADSAKRIKNKASINSDAEGDVEILRKEIKLLREELEAAKRFGNRPSDVQEEAVSALPSTQMLLPASTLSPYKRVIHQPEGGSIDADELHAVEATRRALVGALRREEQAVLQSAALSSELEGMKALLAAKDASLHRTQMMLKLKENRLARSTRNSRSPIDEEASAVIESLQDEIRLLKHQYDAHPDVKRFAMENLRLGHEISRLQSAIDSHESTELAKDVDMLRHQVIRLQEALENAESQHAVARAEADAAIANLSAAETKMQEALAAQKTEKPKPSQFAEASEGAVENVMALKQNIEQLQQENDELKLKLTQMTEIKDESSRLYEHAARLESESECLRTSLRKTLNDLEFCDASYMMLLQEVVESWDTMAQIQNAKERQEIELENLYLEMHGKREIYEKEISSLRSQCDDAQEVERSLVAEKRNWENQNEDLVHEIENLKERVTASECELQKKTERLEECILSIAQLDEVKKDVEKSLLEAQAESRAHRSKAEVAQQQALKQAERVANLQKLLKNKEDEITKLKENNALISGVDTEVGNELKRMQQELSRAEKEQARLREALAEAMSRGAELNEQLEEAESAVSQLEYELSDKSATLMELRVQLSNCNTRLTAAKVAEKEAIKKLEDTQGQLDRAVRSGNSSERERGILIERIQQLEHLVSESRNRLPNIGTGPLEQEQQLVSVKKQVTDLRRELNASKEFIKKLEAQLDKKDEDLGRIKSQMQSEVTEAAQLVQQQLEALHRAEVAERKLMQLEKKLQEDHKS